MDLKKMLDVIGEEENKFRIPDYAEARCNVCDWKGKVKDCPVEIDSEGWEYPDYEVLVCPKCGEIDIAI